MCGEPERHERWMGMLRRPTCPTGVDIAREELETKFGVAALRGGNLREAGAEESLCQCNGCERSARETDIRSKIASKIGVWYPTVQSMG